MLLVCIYTNIIRYILWFNLYSFLFIVPPAPRNAYKTNFLEDFWHLNVVMWNTNNALVIDPDKDDTLASGPTEWPMVTVGLRMCSWNSDDIKYYLIGNPSVWWFSFITVMSFPLIIATYNVRQRRQIIDMTPGKKKQ